MQPAAKPGHRGQWRRRALIGLIGTDEVRVAHTARIVARRRAVIPACPLSGTLLSRFFNPSGHRIACHHDVMCTSNVVQLRNFLGETVPTRSANAKP
jgi:hypothetical protein